jgi:hypothetical protein
LVRAAEQLLGENPETFLFEQPFGITVVFGRTTPEVEGYGAIDPILEILTDVGVSRGVRQERREREVRTPKPASGTHSQSNRPTISRVWSPIDAEPLLQVGR